MGNLHVTVAAHGISMGPARDNSGHSSESDNDTRSTHGRNRVYLFCVLPRVASDSFERRS